MLLSFEREIGSWEVFQQIYNNKDNKQNGLFNRNNHSNQINHYNHKK